MGMHSSWQLPPGAQHHRKAAWSRAHRVQLPARLTIASPAQPDRPTTQTVGPASAAGQTQPRNVTARPAGPGRAPQGSQYAPNTGDLSSVRQGQTSAGQSGAAAARLLTKRLSAAPSHAEIHRLLHTAPSQLLGGSNVNAKHVVAAVVRFAELAGRRDAAAIGLVRSEETREAGIKSEDTCTVLWDELQQLVSSWCEQLTAREVANVLWAVGRLSKLGWLTQLQPHDNAASGQRLAGTPTTQPQQHSSLSSGCALVEVLLQRLGCVDGVCLADVAQAMWSIRRTVTSCCIDNKIISSTLDHLLTACVPLFDVISQQPPTPASTREQHVKKTQQQDSASTTATNLVIIIFNLAKLHPILPSSSSTRSRGPRVSHLSSAFMNTWVLAFLSCAPACQPKLVADAVWAVARLQHMPSTQQLTDLQAAVLVHVPRMKRVSLAMAVWGLGSLHYQHAAQLKQSGQQVDVTVQLNAAQVDVVMRSIQLHVMKMKKLEVLQVLHGCALLQRSDNTQTLRYLVHTLLRRLNLAAHTQQKQALAADRQALCPRELSTLLWDLAALNHVPDAIWQAQYWTAVRQHVGSTFPLHQSQDVQSGNTEVFTVQDTAQLLRAVGRLGLTPPGDLVDQVLQTSIASLNTQVDHRGVHTLASEMVWCVALASQLQCHPSPIFIELTTQVLAQSLAQTSSDVLGVSPATHQQLPAVICRFLNFLAREQYVPVSAHAWDVVVGHVSSPGFLSCCTAEQLVDCVEAVVVQLQVPVTQQWLQQVNQVVTHAHPARGTVMLQQHFQSDASGQHGAAAPGLSAHS